MKLRKRIAALLLSATMILQTSGIPAFAAVLEEPADTVTGGLCAHHTHNTAECGYEEEVIGAPCRHEHTEDCYEVTTECIHQEHTAECYPDGDTTAEPNLCGHICSEESGCITKKLNCPHKHDETCGYVEAVPGSPCTFVCEICNAANDPDEPDEAVCICTEPCTDGAVNPDCPVCHENYADCTAETTAQADETLPVEIIDKTDISKNIIWADNRNEDESRPTSIDAFDTNGILSFSMDDGKTYIQLTEENMAAIGLESLPQPQYKSGENIGAGKFFYSDLPSKIKDSEGNEQEIAWKMEQPKIAEEGSNYDIASLKDPDPDSWYYVLTKDLVFYLDIHMGDNYEDPIVLKGKIDDTFDLHYVIDRKTEDGGSTAGDKVTMEKIPPEDYELTYNKEEKRCALTIKNAWKYDIDNAKIEYYIHQIEGVGEPGKITDLPREGEPTVQENDYLKISYDNTGVPNYSQYMDRIYSGGTIDMILTGETEYTATKVWIDPNGQTRPECEFQLWRYLEGQPFDTADVVRHDDGTYYMVTLTNDPNVNEQSINMDLIEGLDKLPRYNAEGYRYIYGLREYLDNGTMGYEQIFGSVTKNTNEDGAFNGIYTVTDTLPKDKDGKDIPRVEGDQYIYNKGIITNRYQDGYSATATKQWKAAAFQSDLRDVRVEMTLQCRKVKDDKGQEIENGEWNNVPDPKKEGQPIQAVKDGFREEELGNWNVGGSYPKYDEMGCELKYRWVETGVYQGKGSEDNLLKEDGTFTLKHNGREITYRSVPDENGLITNGIDNKVNYEVTKQWAEDITPEEVTFDLYRIEAGSEWSSAVEKPYLTFTVNGEEVNVVAGPHDEEGIVVELAQASENPVPWKAVVENLPEFDEFGRPYQYILMERQDEDNNKYYPHYTTSQDVTTGYYSTTVVNSKEIGEGENNSVVMVAKEWLDDGDSGHRGEVTVGIYSKDSEGDEPLKTATLNPANGWHQLVYVGNDIQNDELYILETEVGGVEVDNSAKDDQTGVYTGEYSNGYHNYAVTYLGPVNVGGVYTYVVRNNRVGDVNITATKNWIDGNGQLRKALNQINDFLSDNGKITPYLQLSFEGGGYEFKVDDEGNDYIDWGVGSMTALPDEEHSVYKIEIKEGENSSEYEWHLPKYDPYGAVVYYSVSEIWKNAEGTEISDLYNYLNEELESGSDKDQLLEVISGYTMSVTQEYKFCGANDSKTKATVFSVPTKIVNLFSGEEKASGKVPADEQTVTVTNRLSGTKNIFWHKQWYDKFAYENGLRPDMYLDIYRVLHDEEGNPTTELYKRDYRWNYDYIWDKEIDFQDTTDIRTHWHIVVKDLPKYDQYGYEIFYYATENVKVDAAAIDYYPVRYFHQAENTGDEENLGEMVEIGSRLDKKEDDATWKGQPCILDLDGQTKPEDTRFALLEGGMFVNGLSDAVTIEGQKLWQSLPDGYEDIDLPGLEFSLKRSYNILGEDGKEQLVEDEKFYATAAIHNWAEIGAEATGTYPFGILYEGHNVVNGKNPDGSWNITVYNNGEENDVIPDNERIPLPRYNEKGGLYIYELAEIKILFKSDLDGDVKESGDINGVFEVYQPDSQTYLAKNGYVGKLGNLSVKKFMELKDVSQPLPAVKFVLTRSYYGTDKNGGPDVLKQDEQFCKESVLHFYVSKADGNLVTGTVEDDFKDLQIYAPNGNPYLYTVTEVKKDFLLGYDTWVLDGNKSMLNVQLAGAKSDKFEYFQLNKDHPEENCITFVNVPPVDTEYITLGGQKQWDDWLNALGLRPEKITLTLYRRADSQPGQGNAISEAEVPDCSTITVTEDNNWSITLPGDESNKLEKYAPNGMPWIYYVKEQGESREYYLGSVTNEKGENFNITNSLKTEVPFEKRWADEQGNLIKEDYFGVDLKVTFKLQVREKISKDTSGTGDWQDAEAYLQGNQYLRDCFTDYSFTKTLQGRINGNTWSGKFEQLPRVIINSTDEVKWLEYRVVEAQVECGGYEQKITVNDSGKVYTISPDGLVTDAAFNNNTTTNSLDTKELSVTKVWESDHNNIYGTRPVSNEQGKTWEARFAVQYSADQGETWNYLQKYNVETSADVILTLSGTNSEAEKTATISGLPAHGVKNGTLVTYEYRIVELQPGNDLVVVGPGEAQYPYYDGTYETGYVVDGDATTVTNTLKTLSKSIAATKVWKPQTPTNVSVTFALQYRGKDNTWKTIDEVTLNGTNSPSDGSDGKRSDYMVSDDGWTVTWADLPYHYPNSNAETKYRVVESNVSDGYTQLTSSEVTKDDAVTYTFINVPKTSLAVYKNWPGAADKDKQPITVGLYRKVVQGTTDLGEQLGEEEPVKDKDGNYVTYVLNSTNNWQAVFKDLPACNADGDSYRYYARELTQLDDKWTVDYTDEIVTDFGKQDTFVTTVYNVPLTEIAGTKTWLDNSNAYGTRPAELQLTLYRTTDSPAAEKVEWEEVTDVLPVWTCTDQNTWHYVYSGLREFDHDGKAYRYRVEESVPGIVNKIPDTAYELSKQEGYDLTNRITGKIKLRGIKTWYDHHDRPDEISIRLYRTTDTDEPVNWTEVEGVVPVWMCTDRTHWGYTYEDLDKYDENGVLYTYQIVEEVPDGYDELYDGLHLNISNYQRGGLEITKNVTGNRGERDREFHFILTLSGVSSTGIPAEAIDDGEALTGSYADDILFHEGVAEFTLKHGETATFRNLPAGLEYTLIEVEANTRGYTSKITANGIGVIRPGATDELTATNRRHHSPFYPDEPKKPKEETPKDVTPPTNDPTNPGLWAATSLAFLLAAGGLASDEKRHRRPKEDPKSEQ